MLHDVQSGTVKNRSCLPNFIAYTLAVTILV